jgi:hypothetical protein
MRTKAVPSLANILDSLYKNHQSFMLIGDFLVKINAKNKKITPKSERDLGGGYSYPNRGWSRKAIDPDAFLRDDGFVLGQKGFQTL